MRYKQISEPVAQIARELGAYAIVEGSVARSHPAARERAVQVQFVQLPHQEQVLFRDRARLVVRRATADRKNLGLTLKKSFSSVSCPIFACRVCTSTAASAGSAGSDGDVCSFHPLFQAIFRPAQTRSSTLPFCSVLPSHLFRNGSRPLDRR
jgi:hypothetical protein